MEGAWASRGDFKPRWEQTGLQVFVNAGSSGAGTGSALDAKKGVEGEGHVGEGWMLLGHSATVVIPYVEVVLVIFAQQA